MCGPKRCWRRNELRSRAMAEIVNLRLARKKKARAEKKSARPKTGSRSAAQRPSATRRKPRTRLPNAVSIFTVATTSQVMAIKPGDGISSVPSPLPATAPASRWNLRSGRSCGRCAERDAISIQNLIGRIDAERGDQNLSSAIRVYVINRFRAEVIRQGEAEWTEAG